MFFCQVLRWNALLVCLGIVQTVLLVRLRRSSKGEKAVGFIPRVSELQTSARLCCLSDKRTLIVKCSDSNSEFSLSFAMT